MRCTYIGVEQVSHTNAMILAKPSWIWGAEIGVNEHGVCMGNESVFSREMNTREKALLGMDIVRLTLERSETAADAVRIVGELMERYGQGGNAVSYTHLVRPGINMVINIDGKRAGVVGITGDPEQIKPVALITKMAIEAMLKYEKQHEELMRRQNRKERFLSLLIHEEYTDPATLRSVARQLNYSEEMIRIPILCILPDGLAESFLETIKKGSRHSKDCLLYTSFNVVFFRITELSLRAF